MTYQQSSRVDDYIKEFPEAIQERLTFLRRAIQATFPNTIEDISYGMPTYRPAPGKRGIVHFANAKDHVGLYAIFEPKTDSYMHEKMSPYRSGRGTLQFKHSEVFPKATIRKILAFHATQQPK